jgi:hypothetical protein
MQANLAELNRAFWDLGLRFSWDEKTLAAMGSLPDLGACLAHYLKEHQPHLLGVYDVDFLRGLIEQRLANPSADARMGMEAHRSF